MSTDLNQAYKDRLNAVIAWGSSTCSKSAEQMPDEPAVIVSGNGCRVTDANGKVYIDYRNGLGPVSIGYAVPEVNAAIQEQLAKGIVYGYPHPLEAEVAELLCSIVPAFERVRFLKTGGEAVAAAIRVARAFTGRDHVIQIGYNGWLNTLADNAPVLPGRGAKTRAHNGVPAALSQLHHVCPWNQPDRLTAILDSHPGEFAAIVVAADYGAMADGATFYPLLRQLADRHGCLLIYDEIVTGFRVALAGVQEYFGVTPDLAVFAKGISNGMPLSVFGGRSDVMDILDRGGPLVVSSTYAGDALSLAAAKTVIGIYRRENVVEHIWRQGQRLWSTLNDRMAARGIPLTWQGMWCCPLLNAGPDASPSLRSDFLRAAFRHGVTLYAVSYVNFSHKDADIDETLDRLDAALDDLATGTR